ncbi:TAX2 [Dirofilaria immitis]|nr:TAX2 [Dirofilaria immitis]
MTISGYPSIIVDCQNNRHMNEMNSQDFSDGDNQSRISSFTMKEKLHTSTGSVRHRTSQMIDEIMRESDNDERNLENVDVARKEHRPSLMSLVGLQKDIKETAKRYLHSNDFKIDIFSLMPFDIIYIWTGPIAAWRAVRICKLPSFWQLFSLLDRSVSNPYIISAWQAFGQIAYRMNDKWYLNKWVYNNQGNAYIRCFYFTTAVATSTGNNPAPTNVVEYIYMTFSWMMGVFIRDIVSNANRNREQYRKSMDQVLSECKRLGLSKDIIDRVRDWFIYTWQKQKTLVNDGILEVVSDEQSTKVLRNLLKEHLLAIGGNNRRTANIRSKGYSTLFVLSKEDLNDVIKDYPDAQELLKRKAR